MNTIWLKIAGVAVVVVIVIVVLGRFRGNESAPERPAEPEQKTFYDMADRDKQFQEAPAPADEPVAEPPPEPAAQPVEPPPTQSAVQETAQRPDGVVLPSDITKPTTLYFKPLGSPENPARGDRRTEHRPASRDALQTHGRRLPANPGTLAR